MLPKYLNLKNMALSVAAALLTLAFVSCGGGGKNGPEPGPAASIKLIVGTAFPTGTTKSGVVDVTYQATPGGGASITEVSYSINGGAGEHVYLKGGGGITQKGNLGSAKVILAPGENRIVFRAKDSAGGSATYDVPNTPIFDFGATPDNRNVTLGNSSGGGDMQYVTNRVVVIVKSGATDAQVAQAAGAISGAVIAQVNPAGMYWLQVSGQRTEVQLREMCDQLLASHAGLFSAASLDTVSPMDVPGPEDDPLFPAPQTNDPWWSNGRQWGLNATNVPSVWEAYKGRLHDTKVGVVDNGFRNTHEDLQIPAENIYNRNKADKDHGTHVMGTIGAVHGNGKGVAGVMEASRGSLYGYDAFAAADGAYDSDIIAGLSWAVANGAKAVNFSLGGSQPYSSAKDRLYSDAMRNLLNKGYDFVVVQAAGNSTEDASRAAVFASITDQALRQRVITVGAADSNYQMAYFTNYGSLVDVVAPGVNIYSSLASTDSSYNYYSGTSMAAPHVTGVAGLVWSANPGLSGDKVKQFIVDSAKESGRSIVDARSSVPPGQRRIYYMTNAKAAVDKAVGAAPVVTVSVSPKTANLQAGGTQTFTATVTGTSNTSVTWTATGGSITQVGAYAAPSAAGTYTVTATSQADATKSDTATVTVTPAVAVSVSPKTANLQAGGTQTFTATVTGTSNTSVTWTATGGSITQGGLYTAPSAAGTYTVTATSVADTTKSDTATVTVTSVAVSGVSLNKSATSLTVGGQEQLTPTIQPSNAANQNVTWSSSNNAIATVNNGLVTGVAAGTATITVTTTDGNKTATCAVTVTPAPVVTVSVSPKMANLQAGGTQTFTATVTGTSNTSVTWTATGGSITQGGLYTAPSAVGTYTVTATSVADTTKSNAATVTVVKETTSPTGISLNKADVKLSVGGGETLVAKVEPSGASQAVTWTSSSPGIATVNNGLVTGVSVGAATIIVATPDGKINAFCTVLVQAVPVMGITLEPGPIYLTKRGETKALVPNIVPANATNKNVTWSISFADARDNSATVDANGVVTCAKAGWYTISGNVIGNYFGDATVTARTADGGYVATVKVVTGVAVIGLEETLAYQSGNTKVLAKGQLWGRSRDSGSTGYYLTIVFSDATFTDGNSGVAKYQITLSTSDSYILGVNNSDSLDPKITIPANQRTGNVTITATIKCNFTGKTFTKDFKFTVS